MKKNSRNKNKRDQTPKGGENKALMRAEINQRNMNLTRPSGNVYKRPKAGARGRDW